MFFMSDQTCDWGICKKTEFGWGRKKNNGFYTQRSLENAFAKARKVFHNQSSTFAPFWPSYLGHLILNHFYKNLNNQNIESFFFFFFFKKPRIFVKTRKIACLSKTISLPSSGEDLDHIIEDLKNISTNQSNENYMRKMTLILAHLNYLEKLH